MVTRAPALSFADWLQSLLVNTDGGLSQEAAARRIGVSRNTVQRWLKGQREPRYAELVKVFQAFGTLPPELLRVLLQDKTPLSA